MKNITGKRSDPVRKIINIAQKTRQHCIQDTLSSRARPLGRVRRASKGILHTSASTAIRN